MLNALSIFSCSCSTSSKWSFSAQDMNIQRWDAETCPVDVSIQSMFCNELSTPCHSLTWRNLWTYFILDCIKLTALVVMPHLNSLQHFLNLNYRIISSVTMQSGTSRFGFTLGYLRDLSCHQPGFLQYDWASNLSECLFKFVLKWSSKNKAVIEVGVEMD